MPDEDGFVTAEEFVEEIPWDDGTGWEKPFMNEGWCIVRKDVYEIEPDRIQDEGDIIKWVVQLSQKNWMTAMRLGAFVECICDHLDIEYVGI